MEGRNPINGNCFNIWYSNRNGCKTNCFLFMATYLVEYWYYHGRFEKEFEQVKIEADSEEEALKKVQETYPFIYKKHIIN
jgi:hypothetical protein